MQSFEDYPDLVSWEVSQYGRRYKGTLMHNRINAYKLSIT